MGLKYSNFISTLESMLSIFEAKIRGVSRFLQSHCSHAVNDSRNNRGNIQFKIMPLFGLLSAILKLFYEYFERIRKSLANSFHISYIRVVSFPQMSSIFTLYAEFFYPIKQQLHILLQVLYCNFWHSKGISQVLLTPRAAHLFRHSDSTYDYFNIIIWPLITAQIHWNNWLPEMDTGGGEGVGDRGGKRWAQLASE